eukprot:c18797_g1_i2.p1 GENE.c18797_g1_i2~~c18797_g1_i2.p1  ORF type:complete len:274 (+),score=38.80 c18797_g1_i2:39-824(+)
MNTELSIPIIFQRLFQLAYSDETESENTSSIKYLDKWYLEDVFCRHLINLFDCSPDTIVIGAIYLNRISYSIPFDKFSPKWAKLILMSIILASKWNEKVSFNFTTFAEKLEMATAELSQIELFFLESISYNLKVDIFEADAMAKCVINGLFSLNSYNHLLHGTTSQFQSSQIDRRHNQTTEENGLINIEHDSILSHSNINPQVTNDVSVRFVSNETILQQDLSSLYPTTAIMESALVRTTTVNEEVENQEWINFIDFSNVE